MHRQISKHDQPNALQAHTEDLDVDRWAVTFHAVPTYSYQLVFKYRYISNTESCNMCHVCAWPGLSLTFSAVVPLAPV